MAIVLFAVTSFVTAGLLFLVQPMVGKMVLPAFGGAPQVWTTAMLFFQMALLAGYGYTHLATTRLTPRVQPRVHLAVIALPLLVLPIALTVQPSGRPGLAPSLELLAGLTIGVAAPFILVATSGPLLQRWFSWTDHPRAQDPYFLYAAGNAGSMVGLLAYPFVLERWLDVPDQSRLWALGYVVMLLLVAACGWYTMRHRASEDMVSARGSEEPASPVAEAPGQAAEVTPRRMARWILLAFVASSLMLAVTTHLTTDVAAVPLLWIWPLALYLGTFVIAFGTRGGYALRAATVLVPAIAILAIAARASLVPVRLVIIIQLTFVLVGGLVAHGQLAADRPSPRLLTRYYLLIAVGGALGGVFNGLVAPVLFPAVWEHAITAVLVLALVVSWRGVVPGLANRSPVWRALMACMIAAVPVAALVFTGTALAVSRTGAWLVLALAVAVGVTLAGRSLAFVLGVVVLAATPHVQNLALAADSERTFFGVHRIVHDGDLLTLLHGTTLHGSQDRSSPEARRLPLLYYHPAGPLGDALPLDVDSATIGVLGLGTGAVAAYGRVGQHMVFHEIDPAIVDIANGRFSYLADSRAEIDVVLGDGRLTVGDLEPGSYDLLIADAFSSDSIPVHLLTVEALATYLDAVGDGIVLLHVSNRYLDLVPVLGGSAGHLGVPIVARTGGGDRPGSVAAVWVAVARDTQVLDPLRDAGWQDVNGGVVWTDRRSDLVSVLR